MDSVNGGGRKNSTNSLNLKVEAFPKSRNSRQIQIAQSATRYLKNRFNYSNKYFILGLIGGVLIISAGILIPIAISFNRTTEMESSSTSTTEMESTSTSTSWISSSTSKPPLPPLSKIQQMTIFTIQLQFTNFS